MPDFLKKARKQTAATCVQGEEPIAALFVRPRSGDELKRLGAPGGALSRMGRFADETAEDDGNPFAQNCVLVLTDQRLLAFAHGALTGRVRELIGALPVDDIDTMALDTPDEGPASLTITFADGEAVDVTPGSRRQRFVTSFARLKGHEPHDDHDDDRVGDPV